MNQYLHNMSLSDTLKAKNLLTISSVLLSPDRKTKRITTQTPSPTPRVKKDVLINTNYFSKVIVSAFYCRAKLRYCATFLIHHLMLNAQEEIFEGYDKVGFYLSNNDPFLSWSVRYYPKFKGEDLTPQNITHLILCVSKEGAQLSLTQELISHYIHEYSSSALYVFIPVTLIFGLVFDE